MRKLLIALLIALPTAAVLAQYDSGYTDRPTLTVNASDPVDPCAGAKIWINSTTGDSFACYNGIWNAFGGGAASFPITETLGAITTTLDADLSAPTGSWTMTSATDSSGFNFGVDANVGWELSAQTATAQAFISGSPTSSNPIDIYYQPGLSPATHNRIYLSFGNWYQESLDTPGQASEVFGPTSYYYSMSGSGALSGYSVTHSYDISGAALIQDGVDDPAGIGITRQFTPRGEHLPAGSVASATTITPRGNLLLVTGTSTIQTITAPPYVQCIVLVFSSTATVDSGADNIRLDGGADFVATDGDTLSLCYVAGSINAWLETSRSIN